MRRLLRLSIEGFKTFAGRTDLELGPGMTAVVGPNGSGKSNLIDAIAWAVGARSWKSLRGDGMEDVIFHGSDRKPPAPKAAVTLSFQNEDRLLGIDFSEVTVTREIHRGGGTGLLLNGAQARVKDVHAILSGTGLAGGFSLIRQGVVDKFVLAAPEDIGHWVEESANIAGYRARKQEAVDRLHKVEANCAEAERKGNSLRRELGPVRSRSAQARRRWELVEEQSLLRERLTSLERHRLDSLLEALTAEADSVRADLGAVETAREDAVSSRARTEKDLMQLGAAGNTAEPPPVPELDPRDLETKVTGIREAGTQLDLEAERLERDGSGAWTLAAGQLEKIAGRLLDLREPGARKRVPSPAQYAPRLEELHRLTEDVERLDREARELTAAVSERECELARIQERIAALGEAGTTPLPTDGGFDPEQGRVKLEELGRELGNLGPVDETAEQREAEILRELEELAPILQDLSATRTQLAGFIRQMEQVATQLYAETRAQVEARFSQYCSVLFQGGEARLDAVDHSEDEEEAPLGGHRPGIEVRVKLPRKPETALGLLSGGERSLAGLALVLALASRGSGEGSGLGRLIILDEVDAALDETNAARLALLLRELQAEHQILCVTHNRITMHQASRLVGVTVGSSSISTLVKVHLDRPGVCEPAA